MDKKKSIIIYSDFLHKISKLSDEQAGKLFKGLLNYSNGITPEFDDVLLDYAFEDIKTTIDRDTEKYSLKCLKNKEIALERERIKRERNSTNVNERTQVITNSTDKDNDKDNDIDSDIDSDILLEKETKHIHENKEIHFTVWGNGNTQTVKPIPNSKTDNKPNNKKTYSKLESYFFCSDDWFLIWEKWLEYKSEIKSNYKTNLSESTAYKKLLELSNNNLEIADKIIMQSIENDWKGLFELKNNEKKGSTLNF